MQLLFNDEANPTPNPFLFDEPAIISFSGGRTSGLRLWSILQAHGGSLPDNIKVCFANTGKEREALDFVQACATHWTTPITLLEYDSAQEHSDCLRTAGVLAPFVIGE